MVNWKDLTAKISDPKILKQHYVTSTKLFNAKHHFKILKEIVPTQRAIDLVRIEFGKKKLIYEIPSSPSKKNLQFYDELEFIFYNLRSCIDSFLWEINLLFELRCSKAGQVIHVMKNKFEEKEITEQLNSLKEKTWFKYLSEIRNNLIHRLLSEVAIDKELLLYLPSRPFTNEPNPTVYNLGTEYELFTCLDELIKNAMDFLEKGYRILVKDFPKIG